MSCRPRPRLVCVSIIGLLTSGASAFAGDAGEGTTSLCGDASLASCGRADTGPCEAEVQKAPAESKTWENYGELLLCQGNLRGAANVYRRGLAVLPRADSLRFSLASVLWRLGKPDDASKELRQIAMSEGPKRCLAESLVAFISASAGQGREAELEFVAARHCAPHDANIAADAGDFFYAAGQLRRAVGEYDVCMTYATPNDVRHGGIRNESMTLREYCGIKAENAARWSRTDPGIYVTPR